MPPLARRQQSMFPDLFDWFDVPWTTLLPFTGSQTFRIEDYMDDDHYVIRAELPGVDPAKDVEVTVAEGTLTIHAERKEERKETHRSEFRYGSLTRSVNLPSKADTEHIKAKYNKGILEVSVPVGGKASQERRIAVERAD